MGPEGPEGPEADDDTLTLESLGLSGTPEEEAARPVPAPPAAPPAEQPGFYNHQACPPGRHGCVFSRTVTDERVTTRLDCPAPHGSLVGGYSPRRLVVGQLTIEAADSLHRGRVVHPIHARVADLRSCFGVTGERASVRIVISSRGHVIAVDTDATNAACVSAALGSLAFPSARGSTVAHWRLDYSAEDPRAHAMPIHCP